MNGYSDTCVHTPDCSYCELGYCTCDGTGCTDYEVLDKEII